MNPHRLQILCPSLPAALVAIATLAAPVAAQTGCVTAECVPPPYLFIAERIFGGFNNGEFIPGQTFTPRLGGQLDVVRLGLYSVGNPNDTTRVVAEIRTVEAGFPSEVILARALVSGAPYVAGNLYPAPFASQHLLLEAGARYAITLRTASPSVVYILAALPGCDPSTGSNDPVHSYDGGLTWGYAWFPAERSFVYEVCVDGATPAVHGTWGRVKTLYR